MILGLGSHAVSAGDFANLDATGRRSVVGDELVEEATKNIADLAVLKASEAFGFLLEVDGVGWGIRFRICGLVRFRGWCRDRFRWFVCSGSFGDFFRIQAELG